MTLCGPGRAARFAPPEGVRFTGLTTFETGDRVLIRETYANADGRLLVLYRHAASGTPDDGEDHDDV